MKSLFAKKRERRTDEVLSKTFLLLILITLTFGVRISLIHEDTGSSLNRNIEAMPGLPQAQKIEKKKVDLNSASEEDLMKLPGIGEKTAKKILEYKEKNGPYSSIESIMEVNGMGRLKFEKIEPFIEIK